ncbi:hypothetical protein RSSM_02248 [Rhodopirellula sallentina SM41]|uniref:Uncharacterized protein n=1 Tax=Rhodopirellula sallentina SM41 TaxID=1263870 RepID=M5U4B7_9BACT|nr:hypothetical protein RSSM_02248 [Rhodopirellula sallentina SM41]
MRGLREYLLIGPTRKHSMMHRRQHCFAHRSAAPEYVGTVVVR